VQAEVSDEVEAAAVCSNDDIIVSSEEYKFASDKYSNVDAIIECHAASPTDDSLPLAVSGEIQKMIAETSPSTSDDKTELDDVTGDGGDGQTDAVSADASMTVQPVDNSDIPLVAATTADSNSSQIRDADTVSPNTTPNHKQDLEANDVAIEGSPKVLVEEIGGSESAASAESNRSKEATRTDKPDRPDTILSWSDSARDRTTSKIKCAVQFENSIIFDLDVE